MISIAAFTNKELFDQLKFYPYIIKRERNIHRFLSYGFIHADFMHLFVNMYVLYVFGENVENAFTYLYGKNAVPLFVALYFGGLIMSTVYSYFKNKDNVMYSAVGASGAVSAVVFASIVFFPTAKLMIFPLPFQISAWVFGGLYLVYSFIMARHGKDNIGHDAHFFGAIYGIVFIAIVDFRFILRMIDLL